MRLLVVSQYFWPENFRVNELVAEMTARGHEVTVLTGRPNYPDGEVFPEFKKAPGAFSHYAGAQVFRVPLRPRGKGSLRLVMNYWSFVFWGCTLGAWQLRGRSFDALFVFETSPITSAFPAIFLSWLKKAPLSMWVLDLWPETLSAVGVIKSPTLLNGVGQMVRYIYKKCDLIFAQSQAFFANIEHWSGDRSKIRYLPGWAEAVFESSSAEVRRAEELVPFSETFNVMFAGNIGEAQDFPAILQAAERLRDLKELRWLIVGDGRMADWVRTEVHQRGLQKCVIMLGRHSLERMPSFFCGADALLVSLKADPIFAMTIPGKVQAYLAAGRPVLGMLDGEGARVITESGSGLVCGASDGEGLARNVEILARMTPAEREAMGQKGPVYCKNEFDRSTLIDRLSSELVGMTRNGN